MSESVSNFSTFFKSSLKCHFSPLKNVVTHKTPFADQRELIPPECRSMESKVEGKVTLKARERCFPLMGV